MNSNGRHLVSGLALGILISGCFNGAADANAGGAGGDMATSAGSAGSGGSSGETGSGGEAASSGAGQGGGSTGPTGSGGSGGVGSSTGSGGGAGVDPLGVDVMYRFTLPAGEDLAGLTIYDEADDTNGDPLPRPLPFGATDFDKSYAWGTATDAPGKGCYLKSGSKVECFLHRPSGAKVKTNTHVQFGNKPDKWACQTAQGGTFGTFEVFVQGQSASLETEPWLQGANEPFCRFTFSLP